MTDEQKVFKLKTDIWALQRKIDAKMSELVLLDELEADGLREALFEREGV